MQGVFTTMLAAVLTVFTMSSSILAMNHSQGGAMTSSAGATARPGDNILTATVDGHQFAYHLIDMHKQMAKTNNPSHMQGMKAKHHLMVYVTKPDGTLLDKAKVGYLVVGPDGAKQTQMGMEMQGGFGADLHFEAKGTYSVTTKAVTDGKTLMHQFTHEMK